MGGEKKELPSLSPTRIVVKRMLRSGGWKKIERRGEEKERIEVPEC
jgi:hypothetical protein